jgi:hypothetical protein
VQVGCARIFNMRDQYEDEHYNARDMTVPVLDHQSGVPRPGVWRGAENVADPWQGVAWCAVDRGEYERYSVTLAEPG